MATKLFLSYLNTNTTALFNVLYYQLARQSQPKSRVTLYLIRIQAVWHSNIFTNFERHWSTLKIEADEKFRRRQFILPAKDKTIGIHMRKVGLSIHVHMEKCRLIKTQDSRFFLKKVEKTPFSHNFFYATCKDLFKVNKWHLQKVKTQNRGLLSMSAQFEIIGITVL